MMSLSDTIFSTSLIVVTHVGVMLLTSFKPSSLILNLRMVPLAMLPLSLSIRTTANVLCKNINENK